MVSQCSNQYIQQRKWVQKNYTQIHCILNLAVRAQNCFANQAKALTLQTQIRFGYKYD